MELNMIKQIIHKLKYKHSPKYRAECAKKAKILHDIILMETLRMIKSVKHTNAYEPPKQSEVVIIKGLKSMDKITPRNFN